MNTQKDANNYKDDVYRYYGRYTESIRQKIARPDGLKYLKLFRKSKKCNCPILKNLYRYKIRRLQKKTFIQIPLETKIGKGFYIGHNGRVIINKGAVIGDNCNIATGVTIGQENRGKRKGCPIVGNSVWIGTNSVIVGKITIGDDVLIAPLSYVNFDIPAHSIVIGNPAKIIQRSNATQFYIEKTV